MKIQKSSSNSMQNSGDAQTEQRPSSYLKATTAIRNAIDELGVNAATDPKAKEAIANLGVVLLDLNS